jgi:RHS repeat-associated protein
MLVEADDPRYPGRAKRIGYVYRKDRFGSSAGMIHKEINPVTKAVYASLELDPANPRRRIVHYTDDRTVSYELSSGADKRKVERVDSLGRTTRYEYAGNGKGALTAKVRHDGRRVEFAAGPGGRPFPVRHSSRKASNRPGGGAAPHASAHAAPAIPIRDAHGRALQHTDSRGRTSMLTRDHKGRITRVTDARGKYREYTYDATGRLASMRNPEGRMLKFERNGSGLITRRTNPEGKTIRYDYDAYGRRAAVTDPEGRTTRVERNERGLVTRRINPDGSVRLYSYDKYGRKLSETDELGRVATWEYDDLSRLTRHQDFAGGVTLYDYTETPGGCGTCSLVSNPTRVVNPDGRIDEFLYDTEGRMLMKTIAAGTAGMAVTLYAYDADNNLVQQTNPDGGVIRNTYATRHRRLSTTDPIGRLTAWTYAKGSLKPRTETDPSGRLTRMTYDDRGNLTRVVAPGHAVTTHAYDAKNRRIRTTDALRGTTRWKYDANGRLTSATDAEGAITTRAHDKSGRLATITFADGKQQTFTYDGSGRMLKTRNHDGLTTENKWDAAGRIIAVTTSANPHDKAVVRHTHDPAGRRLSTTDALGRTTQWAYNVRNQIVETIFPDGARTQNEYDDTSGRLLASIDQLGHATRYTYTALGDMATLTDANGNTYSFEYDTMRRKTAMIYPDGTRETWTHDLGGRIATYTTRAGQTKTIAYNADGRPVSETWIPAGCAPDVAYAYDAATGRLLSADNGNALLSYTHDKRGRITSETTDIRALLPDMAPHTVGYEYDARGRKAGLIYPDGMKVTYHYDAQGRMTEIYNDDDVVVDAAAAVSQPAVVDNSAKSNPRNPSGRQRPSDKSKITLPLAIYEYDAHGRRSKLTRDNGVVTNYTYDLASQVLAIDHLGKDNKPLAFAHYEYDNRGRRTNMTREDNQTDRYRYDATSQLTGVDYGIPTGSVPTGSAGILPAGSRSMGVPPMMSAKSSRIETFTYDPLGNRIEHTDATLGQPPMIEYYETNNLNQYTRITQLPPAAHSSQQTYDANGNLADDGTQHYKYDAQNRLVEVESISVKAEFAYDAQNRCISRRYYARDHDNGGWILNGADSLILIYDLYWNLLVDRNVADVAVSSYIHGNRVDEILMVHWDSQTCYPLADAVGSIKSISDQNGRTAGNYRFDVFGMPENSSNYRFLYSGREWIAPFGIYEHRNRYASPSIGKWLSNDPIRFDGKDFNITRYLSNDGINLIDPSGLNVIALNAPGAVGGLGHEAVLIGNAFDGYTYYSFGSGSGVSGSSTATDNLDVHSINNVGSLGDAIQQVNAMRAADNLALFDSNNVIEVFSTAAEDAVGKAEAMTYDVKSYNFLTNNCLDMVIAVFRIMNFEVTNGMIPNSWHNKPENQNPTYKPPQPQCP